MGSSCLNFLVLWNPHLKTKPAYIFSDRFFIAMWFYKWTNPINSSVQLTRPLKNKESKAFCPLKIEINVIESWFFFPKVCGNSMHFWVLRNLNAHHIIISIHLFIIAILICYLTSIDSILWARNKILEETTVFA